MSFGQSFEGEPATAESPWARLFLLVPPVLTALLSSLDVQGNGSYLNAPKGNRQGDV